MAHSHYDGVRRWPHGDSDPQSAVTRIKRLAVRPQWISHESSIEATQMFFREHGLMGQHITFVSLPYPNHTPDWLIKDIPERSRARQWLVDVLR